MRPKSASIAICIAILSGSLFAQLPLRDEWLGFQFDPITATALDVIGDMNGDGIDDLVVGKAEDYVNFGAGFVLGTGRAAIIDGADGSLLKPFWGPHLGSRFGWSVRTLGDVNGDGWPDFASAAPAMEESLQPDWGVVTIISAVDGQLLHFRVGTGAGSRAGESIVALGDLNGDNVPDMAYSERVGGPSGPMRVRVLSCGTFTIAYTIDPVIAAGDWTPGIVLESAGDLDGDGVQDLAVGIPGAGLTAGTSDVGQVQFFSGATGSFIDSVSGVNQGDAFGSAIRRIEDRDQDGTDELVIGAPGASSVTIVSGASRVQLNTVLGASGFGRSLAVGGDLNGDGDPDIAVGTSAVEQIQVVSGSDLTMLRSVQAWRAGQTIGDAMVMLGDVNSDRIDELVTTSVGDLAQILQGLPVSGVATLSIAGNREYGAPAGARPLQLQWVDIGLPDPTFGGFICTGGDPFALGVVGASLAPDNTTVSGLPLLIAVDMMNLTHLSNFGFSNVGELIHPLALRNPSVAGTRWHVQVFQTSPPFGASNGLELLYTR